MPYIIPDQRLLIEKAVLSESGVHFQSSLFEQLAQQVIQEAHQHQPSHKDYYDNLVFSCMIKILTHQYKSLEFNPSSHGFPLHADTLTLIQSINEGIDSLKKENPSSLEGLLNYSLTRLFLEFYPQPRYRDFNAIAGILSLLKSSAHSIALHGLLSCCQMEFYRVFTGPYEEEKIQENTPVKLSIHHQRSQKY